MGKGKSHHRQTDPENDPEVRTHMLFPGKQREEDETLMGGYGGQSFMKSVFGTGWGRRGTPGATGIGNQIDPRYQITPELLDPFLRGAKQV